MELLIGKFLDYIFDKINEIDVPTFKGLAIMGLIILFLLFIFWLINNVVVGYWKITAIIVGVLLVLEVANLLGGGWEKNE